ncbi:hypothetical protein SPI_00216 [Niveomyces insectorum RCEF 264]|uniref:Uncharacterized protein n=1 Tax=Niveomyces insectorum RCEF 264 TaxID=1081102 RepID=A0A167ZXT9_9HYPO|nr:hypothetical protein SPI_00216 [Niveomyces insectorum RCEF 264]
MSALSIGRLEVYQPAKTRGDFDEIPAGSVMHTAVHDIVDTALRILESAGGRHHLEKLGCLIVEGRWNVALRKKVERVELCLYPVTDESLTRMGEFVTTFLRRLRESFPEVYIMINEVEATTVMWDLIQATDSTARDVYMFHMIVAVTHELCHFLTGYLVGDGRPRTPETVEIEGMSREAGFFFEKAIFGGVVDCFAEIPGKGEKINPHQPGVSYLFDGVKETSPGHPVHMPFLKRFVALRGAQTRKK